ncbi:MAG: hypothetical protein LBT00_12270 [Spirochaetaceae bacterium]|nr:hypothetical protein [Spirochaetaceae bacterium]
MENGELIMENVVIARSRQAASLSRHLPSLRTRRVKQSRHRDGSISRRSPRRFFRRKRPVGPLRGMAVIARADPEAIRRKATFPPDCFVANGNASCRLLAMTRGSANTRHTWRCA